MNRRTLSVLLAVAVGVAVVLLVPADRGGPDGTTIERETGAGENHAARTEQTSARLQGTAKESAPTQRRKPRKASLYGRVIDGRTREGVVGARLVAYRLADDAYRLGWSGADGRFAVYNLDPGRWWLFVWHQEYVVGGLEALLAGKKGEPPPDAMQIVVPEGVEDLPRRTIELFPGRRIEGRIVDEAGRPVPGMRLKLKDGAWRDALEARLDYSLDGYERYVPLQTDDEGRFVIGCLPPEFGTVRIGASGADHVTRWSDEIVLDRGRASVWVELVALRLATVSGHVKQQDGSPGVPASVGIHYRDHRRVRETWATKLPGSVRAGADGSYALVGLPPDALTLQADWARPRMEGVRQPIEALAPGEERTVDLVLPPRYIVRGRLQTSGGEPLPGEHLFVYLTEEDGTLIQDVRGAGAAPETTEDGTFSSHVPVAGPFTIAHLRPGGTPEVLREGLVLPVDDLVLVSTASPRTRIELRVKDVEGRPVPRFLSNVSQADDDGRDDFFLLSTDVRGRDGVAVHEALGEPPFVATVHTARDADREYLPLGRRQVRIEHVPPDGVVEVTLYPRDLILGRVLGPDGRPVAGVELTLVDRGMQPPKETAIPVDGDGRFEHMATRDRSGALELRVTVPPGYVEVAPLRPIPGDVVPTIVLRRGGAIGGRVIVPADAEAQPAGEPIRVRVTWKEPEPGRVEIPVDADGRWRAGVPVGVDLTAEVRPWSAMRRGCRPVPAREGLRAGQLDVVFRLAAGQSIAGTCVMADGSPPPPKGLFVFALPMDDEDSRGSGVEVSSDGGRFFIGGLAPGRHALRVSEARTQLVVFDRVVTAGTKDLRIRLPERGLIRIEVADPPDWESSGLGINVQLWAAGTTTHCGYVWTGERGTLVLQGLPVNRTYDLVLSDPVGAVGTARRVRVGDTVKVTLERSESMSGTVRRADGSSKALAGSLFAVRDGACFNLVMRPDGTFCREGIAPGRYEIRYAARDGTTSVLARNVEAGAENLDLVLE